MKYLILAVTLSGCFASGGGGEQPQPQAQVQAVSLPTTFPENSCNPAPITNPAGMVPRNADAASFRALFQSGARVTIAVIGDSTTFGTGSQGAPNAIDLLDAHAKTVNLMSAVHNFGIGGAQASVHVAYGTVDTVAALSPRPDAVFIALGINDTVNKHFEQAEMETLIAQVRSYGMLPVLVHENNMACMTASVPSPFWLYIRNEIDLMAIRNGLDIIDLGTPDGALDYNLLADQAHPNAAGYRAIFQKYKTWLEII